MKKILLLLSLTLFTFIQAEVAFEYELVTSDKSILKAQELSKKGWLFDGMKDRAVFLIVFGTHCPPCLEEMPRLIEAVKKHADKLSIVAIEAQGANSDQLATFKTEKEINYTLLSRKEKQNEYLLSDISTKLNWRGELPFLIAIDKHGEVQEVKMGAISHDKIEELVEKLNK